MLAVIGKLAASGNVTGEKGGGVGGVGSSILKSIQERANQPEAVNSSLQYGLGFPVRECSQAGSQGYKDLFLVVKIKPGWVLTRSTVLLSEENGKLQDAVL